MSESTAPGNRIAMVLTTLTCLVLLATASFQLIWVLPVFTQLLVSVGGTYGLPARLAFEIGRFGFPLGLLVGVVIGLYVWYRKTPGRPERLVTALSAAALLLALFVALVTSAYTDVAIQLPAMHPASTTNAPTPAPAAPTH